ncbi:11963_t:CDS:2, partial [Funneliformis geosporum]
NCHDLQEFYFAKAHQITDNSISYILNSCLNLRKLDIAFSPIIKRSPNLRHIEISGNDIDDKVTEALAHTYHKLEYLDLSYCSFV